jgi:hypothetical protein
MRTLIAVSAAAALAIAATAQAQTTYQWPSPETTVANDGQRFHLPAGTPLTLRTRTQISTKDNKPGDRVYLEVAESVYFRGQVVIPAGAPVYGEVVSLQRNGHLGKKGKLEVRLIQAETPSGPVRLTGRAYDEGKSGTALSVGTMLFVSALGGFFIHGTSAEIPAGTEVLASLEQPLRFTWDRKGVGAQAFLKSYEPNFAQSEVRPALPLTR